MEEEAEGGIQVEEAEETVLAAEDSNLITLSNIPYGNLVATIRTELKQEQLPI